MLILQYAQSMQKYVAHIGTYWFRYL